MVRSEFDQFDGKEVARLLALVEAQRRYYQDMVDALPVPVALLAADQTVVWANRAFRQASGLRARDLRNKPLDQILSPMPPMTQLPLRAWDDDDQSETLVVVQPETSVRTASGSGTTSTAAARADALYTFAGQVAHDLNNPLMIVTGYAEEMLESLPLNNPLRINVGEILTAAGRMSNLGTQLVDIARKHARPAGSVNIADVIATFKTKLADAKVEPGPSPLIALADAEQLSEILLTIASGRTKIVLSWSMEGGRARIIMQAEGSATDTARGAAIFDPVVTKTVDPAAGMTLARAYNIVRDWGGDISFSGSTFTIYLPTPDSGPAAAEPVIQSTREAVLVVEDEPGIRSLLVKILRREGYQVSEVATAEDALATLRTAPVRLLITDVKLPGMSGPDLARKLHKTAPAMKVLYISGYTDDATARTGSFPPGSAFLTKPFTLTALIAKVRETLG